MAVVLKGAPLSNSLTATTSDGLPLLRVERSLASASHRRTVLDSNGHQLFCVRKEGFGSRHYYAEVGESGDRLFDVVVQVKLLARNLVGINVANQADPQKRLVRLEYVTTGRRGGGTLLWDGSRVAIVERKMNILSEYHFLVAPGMDPTLATGILVALIDRKKTQANAAAAAGAAA
jgi:uncharacterized protein YxjI